MGDISRFSVDTYSQSLSQSYSAQAGSTASYPTTLIVGSTLMPMLYVYYFGVRSVSGKVSSQDDKNLFEKGLLGYFNNASAMTAGSEQAGDATSHNLNTFKLNLNKFGSMFTSACSRNRDFVYLLTNACAQLLGQMRSRLPEYRPANGRNYYQNSTRTQSSYFPVLNANDPNALLNCMETLRLCYINGLINWDYDLGIRSINIYDGSFATDTRDFAEQSLSARILGLPSQGLFTINKVPRSSWMYHTFTGIDIEAVASIGKTVSGLEGMTTFSWSIHRAKSTPRKLGTSAPSGRASGGRTIAGTMVFALSDHHPLHAIVPDDYPIAQNSIVGQNSELWKPMIMADQIPPFDLVLVQNNEYGFASIVVIYGIEIVDEGVVLGIDNMITEMVLQYTAVAMDPIVQVKPDANGNIDPFGLTHGKTTELWKRREIVMTGAAYTDTETAYQAQYDTMYNAILQRKI